MPKRLENHFKAEMWKDFGWLHVRSRSEIMRWNQWLNQNFYSLSTVTTKVIIQFSQHSLHIHDIKHNLNTGLKPDISITLSQDIWPKDAVLSSLQINNETCKCSRHGYISEQLHGIDILGILLGLCKSILQRWSFNVHNNFQKLDCLT